MGEYQCILLSCNIQFLSDCVTIEELCTLASSPYFLSSSLAFMAQSITRLTFQLYAWDFSVYISSITSVWVIFATSVSRSLLFSLHGAFWQRS